MLRRNLPLDYPVSIDKNITNGDNAAEDTGRSPNAADQAELSERLNNIKAKETLEMRICTRTYTPLFAPTSEDMLYQPHAFAHRPIIHPTTETDSNANGAGKVNDKDTDGTGHGKAEDGDNDASDAEKAREYMKEKLVMNNKWMKGISKEQVDAYNEEYRQWKSSGTTMASGNDTEMVDT